MARDLGIHAHVIERARQDRGHDCSRMSAANGRRAVITALAGRYRPDDQPNQENDPSGSHNYLRKTGSTLDSEGPRILVAFSSTPPTADTRAGRIGFTAGLRRRDTRTSQAAAFRLRCIVAADGLGRKDRAARTRGTRRAHRPAGRPAAARCLLRRPAACLTNTPPIWPRSAPWCTATP